MSGRIRLYYPFVPYPVTEGAYQVVYDQARSLSALGYSVEIVVWRDSPSRRNEKLREWQRIPLAEQVAVTVIGGNESDSAESARVLGRSGETAARRALRVAASLTSRWASPEIFHYPPEIDPKAQLPEADIGIYHYSFAHPWLKQCPVRPERRVVVHFHNFESELARIRAPVSGLGLTSINGWVHRLNSHKLRNHEIELSTLADELWFVSATDLDSYAARTGSRTGLRLVPPTYDLDAAAERARAWLAHPPAERDVILGFVGGMDFEPNRLSLEWIVDDLAPALGRRGFDGRIRVVGRGIPDRLRAAGDRYGFFEWCGFLPSLADFWSRLSFLLVPHIRGSGIRTKLLEAMTQGVPVLANSPAVAALAPDVKQVPLMTVADSGAEWADRILAENEPFQARRRFADYDLRGTSLDGAEVYRFLGEPGRGASLPFRDVTGTRA